MRIHLCFGKKKKVVNANDNRCWRFRGHDTAVTGFSPADKMGVVYRLQGCDSYKDRNTLLSWWLQGGHSHGAHHHDADGTHHHHWPADIAGIVSSFTR